MLDAIVRRYSPYRYPENALFAFLTYAIYMEGLKGLFKAFGLYMGWDMIFTGATMMPH